MKLFLFLYLMYYGVWLGNITINSLNSCEIIEAHLRIHFGKSQVAIYLFQTAIPRIYEPKSTHVTKYRIVYDVMKVNKKAIFW